MRPGARTFATTRERGAILFIALIVLVAMSLAGIALMRSVDTNVLIAGNLAFRQGATAGGDWGIEDARAWITGHPALLIDEQPAGFPFYFASWQQNLDLIGNNPDPSVTNYDWNLPDGPMDLGYRLGWKPGAVRHPSSLRYAGSAGHRHSGREAA